MPISLSSSQKLSLIAGFGIGISLSTLIHWILYRRELKRYEQANTTLPKPPPSIGGGGEGEEDKHNELSEATAITQSFAAFLTNNSISPNFSGGDAFQFISTATTTLQQQQAIANATTDRVEVARLGIHAIHKVIVHLQEALHNLHQLAQQSDIDETVAATAADCSEHGVLREVQNLLEQTILIHERCQQHLTRSVEDYQPSSNDAITANSGGGSGTDTYYHTDYESDLDSFVSAMEYIDLSDLPLQIESCSRDDHLYRAALNELEEGNVPHREVYTKVVHCHSDTEYLAKLHCLRLAVNVLLSDETKRDWLIQLLQHSITRLLTSMNFNAIEFQDSYRIFIGYVEKPEHFGDIEDEMESRGFPIVNAFDILVEFIFFDGLNLLQEPPSSLLGVINNRWLSDNFKRTALDSAVWTLLVAKRKNMKNPRGFMFHLHNLIATLAPALAWGFLNNSDENATQLCTAFRDGWMEFLITIFSQQTRFTCVEDLSDDILIAAKRCIEVKLMSRLLPTRATASIPTTTTATTTNASSS